MKKNIYAILILIGAFIVVYVILACFIPTITYTKWEVSSTMGMKSFACISTTGTIPDVVGQYKSNRESKWNGGQQILTLKDLFAPCTEINNAGPNPVMN